MLDNKIFQPVGDGTAFNARVLGKKIGVGDNFRLWLTRNGGDYEACTIPRKNAINAVFNLTNPKARAIADQLADLLLVEPKEEKSFEEKLDMVAECSERLIRKTIEATVNKIVTDMVRESTTEVCKAMYQSMYQAPRMFIDRHEPLIRLVSQTVRQTIKEQMQDEFK